MSQRAGCADSYRRSAWGTLTLVGPISGRQAHGANKKPALRRVLCEFGSPGWIRTTECLSQSQMPYRLATGLYFYAHSVPGKAGTHNSFED